MKKLSAILLAAALTSTFAALAPAPAEAQTVWCQQCQQDPTDCFACCRCDGYAIWQCANWCESATQVADLTLSDDGPACTDNALTAEDSEAPSSDEAPVSDDKEAPSMEEPTPVATQ